MISSLALGLAMFVVTLCVQMVPTAILIHVATSKHMRGLARRTLGMNFALVQVAASLMLLTHLVNMALWAALFCLCGEFGDFAESYYHSAVNYSCLGYGEIGMSTRWGLLGPLEAIDGIVMFGMSTALIVALVTRLIQRQLKANDAKGDA